MILGEINFYINCVDMDCKRINFLGFTMELHSDIFIQIINTVPSTVPLQQCAHGIEVLGLLAFFLSPKQMLLLESPFC